MRRRVLGALMVLVIGGGAVSACSGKDDAKASPSKATYDGGSATPKSSAGADASTPGKKQKRVADPLAKTYRPVLRDGKRPRPTVKAKPAPMNGTVKYGDGITLDITGIKQGKVTGQGPGVVEGPTTTFSLALRNGSRKAVDLDQVVVTVVYGDPARVSRPVYEDEQQDFAGTIKPGRSAKAVYTFGIPVGQRDQVTIHVDFDAVHTAAVFTGSAT